MSGPIHTGTATGPGGTSHTGGPVPTPRLGPIPVLMRTLTGTLRAGTAHPISPIALDAFIKELNAVHASHVPYWERVLLLAGFTNQFFVSIVEVDTTTIPPTIPDGKSKLHIERIVGSPVKDEDLSAARLDSKVFAGRDPVLVLGPYGWLAANNGVGPGTNANANANAVASPAPGSSARSPTPAGSSYAPVLERRKAIVIDVQPNPVGRQAWGAMGWLVPVAVGVAVAVHYK